jgi:multicomponent Na+:H+ antiporter subunit E
VTGRDRAADRTAIRRMVPMVPILAVFWLVLSAHFEPRMLALGVASLAVVCVMTWRAGLYLHRDLTASFALRLPWFFLWLSGKVFVSSLAVVGKVWSPRMGLRPVVASTPARDLPELSQVTYANSITLTPGTLSLDISDQLIRVHGLDQADIDDLRSGTMLRRLPRPGERR